MERFPFADSLKKSTGRHISALEGIAMVILIFTPPKNPATAYEGIHLTLTLTVKNPKPSKNPQPSLVLVLSCPIVQAETLGLGDLEAIRPD